MSAALSVTFIYTGDDNRMVLIIAASIGAFLVCATAIGVTTCVIAIISLQRKERKGKNKVYYLQQEY